MESAKRQIGQRIFESFNRIHNKTNLLDKKVHNIGDGLILHPAEMDTVVVIGNYPGINITELAKKNGVSKAAESKTVKKLTDKKIVIKQKDKSNKKEIQLKLTDIGRRVFDEQHQHIIKLIESIEKEIKGLSLDQIDNFLKLMNKIEEHLDSHIKREKLNQILPE